MNEKRDFVTIPPEMCLVSQDHTAYCDLTVECDGTGRNKGLDPGDVLLDMQREYYQGNCAL